MTIPHIYHVVGSKCFMLRMTSLKMIFETITILHIKMLTNEETFYGN